MAAPGARHGGTLEDGRNGVSAGRVHPVDGLESEVARAKIARSQQWRADFHAALDAGDTAAALRPGRRHGADRGRDDRARRRGR